MLERNQSLLQCYNNIASLKDWYSTDYGAHTSLQDDGDEPMMDLVTGLETRAQKQTIVSVDREHRDGCASRVEPVNGGRVWALLTMSGSRQQCQEQSNEITQRENL